MPAHYDNFDYPAYWKNRDYEHEAEVIALKGLLNEIPEIEKIVDIGGGFGRLTDTYSYRAKKVILTDPSAKLLKSARKHIKNKNVEFIQTKAENVNKKIKKETVDLAIMVRVLHHIQNPKEVFDSINQLLSDNGYFILEFANKEHLKAMIGEFLRGNILFGADIFPRDIRSDKSKKKKTIPFFNYHPDHIERMLEESGFETIARKSVSNIRSKKVKELIPLDSLLWLEKQIQDPLSYINFGPSIFLLVKKKG